MFAIFDLDGTLANIEHRVHYVRGGGKKDWKSFFKACSDDLPESPIIHVSRALFDAGWHVEVWSGRSEEVRPQTEEWLHLYGVRYNHLMMRGEGDFRDDVVVKSEWLDRRSVLPDLVFDDRRKVVDMWRSKGVKCCQVEPGDF